jgi:hypothetical protein
LLWQHEAGQAGSALAADGNADGVVDQLDLATWREHFGEGSGAASIAAVPEPASLPLAIAMLTTFAAAMRGRRR